MYEDKYHDECAILVRLFTQCVQFGDGIVECLFGKVTRSVGRVQDLIIEDGEVKSETKADLIVSICQEYNRNHEEDD
jgi:hypothetical protein